MRNLMLMKQEHKVNVKGLKWKLALPQIFHFLMSSFDKKNYLA